MAGKNFVISVILNGINNLGPAVRNAQGALNGFARSTQTIQERMNRLGRPMFMAGAAATGALALGAKAFSDFEDSATRTALLTGEVGDSFQKNYDRIAGISKRLAVTVGEGPKAVTESLNMMIQAGLEPADKNLEQLSTNILKFARVTNIGAAESIDRVLGITNAMIGPVRNSNTVIEDTTRTMTSLRNVSVATMVDMNDMTTAVARVAPYAKNAGLTIEETSALVGSFGDEMIRGGVAATRLQQMLFGLTIRTPKAIKALEDIGVSPYDKRTGELRNFLDVWDDLYKVTKSMPPEARNMLFGAVFTRRAAGGAMSLFDLYNKMPDKIRNLVKEAKRNANLWKAFDIQMGTTKGQFDILRSTIQVFIIDAMGPFTNDVLKPAIKVIGEMVVSISRWAKANPQLFQTLVKVAAAGAAFSLVFGGLLLAAGQFIGAIGSAAFGLNLIRGVFFGAGTAAAVATPQIAAATAAMNGYGVATAAAGTAATVAAGATRSFGLVALGVLGRVGLVLGSIMAGLWLADKAAKGLDALTGGKFTSKEQGSVLLRNVEKGKSGFASKKEADATRRREEEKESKKWAGKASSIWTQSRYEPSAPWVMPSQKTTGELTVNIKADKGLKPSVTGMKSTGDGFNFGATLLQGGTTPAQGLP